MSAARVCRRATIRSRSAARSLIVSPQVASATTVTVCALSAAQIWSLTVAAVRSDRLDISVRMRALPAVRRSLLGMARPGKETELSVGLLVTPFDVPTGLIADDLM